MLIVGRITKDAIVKHLKSGKAVVNFSIAVNDFYKPKEGDVIKQTSYYNCSYWINSKATELLKKGSLVEVNGRIYVNAYHDANGNAKASINCHVNNFKIHSKGKDLAAALETNESINEEIKDDLPF